MTDQIHTYAQSDTPATVQVPASWTGLAIWALGRFGGIVVATAFLVYAWNDSNTSHKRQTERLIEILESKSRTETELSLTLAKLTTAIDGIAAEARTAHRHL